MIAGTIIEIHLPQGLVGLCELQRFALLREAEAAPFLRLCSLDEPHIEFVAIEPAGWVPDYVLEVGDEDAGDLRLEAGAEDAMVLTLVTVRRHAEPALTLNLLAPLVINRHTGRGRQIVLADAKRYSTAHPLGAKEEAGLPC